VVVWFFITEEGLVQDTRISRSSGQAQLDEAALRVADVLRFTPAMNRDEAVAVWIEVPVTFQVIR
jgi:protein TonB